MNKKKKSLQCTRLPCIRWLRRPLLGSLITCALVALIITLAWTILVTTGIVENLDQFKLFDDSNTDNDAIFVWLMLGYLSWIMTNLPSPAIFYWIWHRRMAKADAIALAQLSTVGYQLFRWSWFVGLLAGDNLVLACFAVSFELSMICVAIGFAIPVGIAVAVTRLFLACRRQLISEAKEAQKH